MVNIESILKGFGIVLNSGKVEVLQSGHINNTFKVEDVEEKTYILQGINTQVFQHPEYIAHNIKTANEHLKKHHPQYFFSAPIHTLDGRDLFIDQEGKPWRVFNYIPGTVTLNELENTVQAFHAAKEFARLGKLLSNCDEKLFYPTIPGFQDLNLRFGQLMEAIKKSTDERKAIAEKYIKECQDRKHLVDTFNEVTREGGGLKPRVTHNDTKINNVLFKEDREHTICVIDLDTLMPGYFIYDLGDMVRTFVPPVSEEEKDISKITFRSDIYKATLDGYLSEMGSHLSEAETALIVYSGMMMTFIMALRFLADYLNGNVYYKIHYPSQNIVRAANQLAWLKVQEQNADEMQQIAEELLKKYRS